MGTVLGAFCVLIYAATAWAQNQGLVVRDGSIGGPGGIVAPGVDDLGQPADYLIRGDLGEQRGGNLLHSFDRFSIGTGETATFTDQGLPGDRPSIDHVISRVTSGSVSEIDGTLRSTIDGADVWLMNPNGLVFGQNAHLDVPAGFHASTADSLELANGEVFEARRDAPLPALAIAPPEAFGFLGDADVRIDGLLGVPEGETLSVAAGGAVLVTGGLSAGSITVTTTVLRLEDGAFILSTTSGAGDAGDIVLEASEEVVLSGVNFSGRGSAISASTRGNGKAGSVRVTAPRVRLGDGAVIATQTFDSGTGGDIVIVAAESVTFSGADAAGSVSRLEARGFSEGDAGSITVTTPVLRLEDGAAIESATSGAGDAGDIVIEASEDVVLSGVNVSGFGSAIGASSFENRNASVLEGNAGSVRVTAPRVRLGDGAFIASETLSSGTGGEVRLEVGELHLTGGSAVSTGGSGAGGDINIVAAEGVTISGANAAGLVSRLIASATSEGDAGSITVTTPVLRLEDGAFIGSATSGAGKAGNIVIEASEDVVLSGVDVRGIGSVISASTGGNGNAGSVRVRAPRVRLGDGAFVASNTFDSGMGAEVRLEVGELHLTGGSAVSAGTFGSGDGGDIVIVAAEGVTISGPDIAGFRADAFSEGDAGSITVTTPVLRLEDGVFIESRTFGAGDAGTIVIEASEDVLLSGVNFEGRGSAILASTFGNGNAGSVLVTAPRVRLGDGALIATDTFGLGTGGDIVIVAAEGVTLSGTDAAGSLSRLEAGAFSEGDAGSITVTTPVLRLEDGAMIQSATFGAGDAGDIVIEASEDVVLSGVNFEGRGSAISALTLGDGNAGSVRVTARRVRLGDRAFIASSTFGSGPGGELRLEVGELHLTGGSRVSAGTEGSGAAGDIIIVAAGAVTITGAKIAGSVSSRLEVGAFSEGDAGSITVTTPVLRLEDGAVIDSATSGAGDAGDIVIEASEEVVLSGVNFRGRGSAISASTIGNGTAGSVRVTAPRVRLGDGAFVESNTFGSGTGGEVRLEVGELHLTDGSRVSAGTEGSGAAGDIVIVAAEGVTISGANAAGSVSRLEAGAFSEGDAGSITVKTRVLRLEDGAVVSSSTGGPGDAGDIMIEASEDVVLSGVRVDGGGSTIGALTFGNGNAGSVRVTALRVRLEDGALVTSNTFGSGTGGEVSLEVGELHVTGGSAVSVGTSGSGAGGDVVVEASLVEMTDDASISAESAGSGDAGSVRLTADELLAEDGSQISVAATSANGGDVILAVRDRVHLVDSAISADVGEGAGGNILIDPTFVILDHSEIVARAGEGTGGEITIVADALIKDPESLISASAGNPSLSGTVNINAPDVDLAASLAQLSDSALDASDAITPPCSARRRGETPGSFVFSGRQGVPPGPEGPLAAWPGEVPSASTGAGGAGLMLAGACR